MIDQFKVRLSEKFSINKDDKILIGVSGGLDSMMLLNLFLLSGFKKIVVAHCNYQLRGDDADDDEKFVIEFCKEKNISFETIQFDTKKLKNELKLGTQELARKLRYDWFEKLSEKHHINFIATAHHQDDLVENFFIRILRGSGIEGLKAMEWQRGKIIRPLLYAKKNDLLKFANEHQLKFRTDKSNFENDYLRNRVRNLLMPTIEKVQENAYQNVLTTIENITKAEKFYQKSIDSNIKKYILNESENQIEFDYAILNHPNAELLLFEKLKSKGVNITMINDVLNHENDLSKGKKISHGKAAFIFENRFLVFKISDENEMLETEKKLEQTVKYSDNKILNINNKNYEISFYTKPKHIKYEKHCMYLNADKIAYPITIKNWESGMKFQPFGMKGIKKVSRFLTDLKIGVEEKQNTKVLIDAQNNVLAVFPYRSNENFAVNHTCREVLEFRLIS